jgi:hypothetical protein
MSMITIYNVYVNSDLAEGLGSMVFKAAFENKEDAEKAANEIDPYCVKGDKPQGLKSGWADIRVSLLFKDYQEYKNFSDEEIKKRALAKLDDYEKKVLGIK